MSRLSIPSPITFSTASSQAQETPAPIDLPRQEASASSLEGAERSTASLPGGPDRRLRRELLNRVHCAKKNYEAAERELALGSAGGGIGLAMLLGSVVAGSVPMVLIAGVFGCAAGLVCLNRIHDATRAEEDLARARKAAGDPSAKA